MTDATPARAGQPWSTTVAIRFSHCDPAGIVYFASHFDILNGVIEDWFIEALGVDYHDVVGARRIGLGYVHAACDFAVPARMGDRLAYSVTVERVGTKSIPLRIIARKDATEMLSATLVIVTTDLDRAVSVPIPDDIRAAVTAYLERHA
jgi:4-hydroxybenzoyl-CoA thioesterase